MVTINEVQNNNTGFSNKSKGRSRVPYHEASETTKKRRINELQTQLETLTYNFENLTDEKKTSDDVNASDKGLAMFLDLQLSRNDYENLREHNKSFCDDKIYLPYSYIREAKKTLLPYKYRNYRTKSKSRSAMLIKSYNGSVTINI